MARCLYHSNGNLFHWCGCWEKRKIQFKCAADWLGLSLTNSANVSSVCMGWSLSNLAVLSIDWIGVTQPPIPLTGFETLLTGGPFVVLAAAMRLRICCSSYFWVRRVRDMTCSCCSSDCRRIAYSFFSCKSTCSTKDCYSSVIFVMVSFAEARSIRTLLLADVMVKSSSGTDFLGSVLKFLWTSWSRLVSLCGV